MNSMTSNPCGLEEISFRDLDKHIRTQVSKTVRYKEWLFYPGAIDMAADDIAQDVSIHLWKISLKRTINDHRAYIRRMVYNKVTDLVRSYKPIYPIPFDENGEICQSYVIVTESLDMGDPLNKMEQEESEQGNIRSIVEFILALPYRQRHAMLCRLKPCAKDIFELEIALQERGIDISQYDWPQDPLKTQQLRASLFIAKKKLAQYIQKRTQQDSSGSR